MTSVRARIMAAAWDSFRQSGIAGTRPEDVARLAGVARSTFYRHFKGIDDALVAVAIEQGQANLRDALAGARQSELGEICWTRFVCCAVGGLTSGDLAELVGQDYMMTVVRLTYGGQNHARYAAFADLIVPALERDIEAGRLAAHIPPQDMAEWLLRQIWSLASVPPFPGGDEVALHHYVECFIVAGLLRQAPPPPLDNLSERVEAIWHSVNRMEQALTTSRPR
ncbi:MAG: TetR/AcrR family transcriptional regulator [Sphingorhabdus sp.]